MRLFYLIDVAEYLLRRWFHRRNRIRIEVIRRHTL